MLEYSNNKKNQSTNSDTTVEESERSHTKNSPFYVCQSEHFVLDVPMCKESMKHGSNLTRCV